MCQVPGWDRNTNFWIQGRIFTGKRNLFSASPSQSPPPYPKVPKCLCSLLGPLSDSTRRWTSLWWEQMKTVRGVLKHLLECFQWSKRGGCFCSAHSQGWEKGRSTQALSVENDEASNRPKPSAISAFGCGSLYSLGGTQLSALQSGKMLWSCCWEPPT